MDRVRDMADWTGVPAAGLLRFNGSAFETFAGTSVGLKTVYASQAGCVGDADFTARTGTDNSAAIQSVLNDGPCDFVFDIPVAVADRLRPMSGSVVRGLACDPAFGVLKLGTPYSTGYSVFENVNPVPWPSTPTDGPLFFENLYVHGNKEGHGSGNDGSASAFSDPLSRATVNLLGHGVFAFAMMGVTGLYMRNVYVHDSPAYGYYLANVRRGRFISCGKYSRAGDILTSDDCFHFRGGCDDLAFWEPHGTSNDDAFGFCANDGEDTPGAITGPWPGTVASGPITNVRVYGGKFRAPQLARFLSATQAAYIRGVTFDGTRGTIAYEDGSYGYAGFLFDKFGVPGDGTKGLVDDVKLFNITLDGVQTGAGAGFAPVHFDQANVGRVRVQDFRTGSYTNPQISPVYSTINAIVQDLKIIRLINEQQLAGLPAVDLHGTHYAVEIDGLEYDQQFAGVAGPRPSYASAAMSFYPTAGVRFAGPCVRAVVRNSKTAGISHVVQCAGYAPGTLVIGDGVHAASKGGAVVKSDTDLPRLVVGGAIDADHLLDVPAGTVPVVSAYDRYASRYLRYLCGGAADTALTGQTIEEGSAFAAATVGSGSWKLSGNNTVYPATGASFVPFPVQPPDESFEVEFDCRKLSAISSGDAVAVTLFATSASDLTDVYEFRFSGTGFGVYHTGAVAQSYNTLPPVNEDWRFRVAAYYVAGMTDKRVAVSYSKDCGRTWSDPMGVSYLTTSLVPVVGLRSITTSGVSASTGHHLGPVTIRSFSQPVPGLPSLPSAELDWDLATGTYQDAARTTAASANNDPVGGLTDQSGNGHHAAQATSGKRGLLIVPGQNSLPVLRLDGVDDYLAVANYAPNPPFYLIAAVKLPTSLGAAGREILGFGGGSTNGRIGLFYDPSRHLGVEASSGYQNSAETAAAGWHIVEVRMANTTLSALELWVDGTAFTMSGGTGTVNMVAPVEFKLGGIPTIEGLGYETPGDYGQVRLYTSAVSDADRTTIRAAIRSKWGTP